ncbi:MAG: VWA domain-containing protein [Pyrinomonadaceae bacterium]|nr:VWA domain-containing protein [Pyrinomonadaceae bacterium]
MQRFLLFLFLLLLFTFSSFAQKPTPTPDDDVVKISTTLIQLDVVVTDKNGKIINDLKQEDFEIYENGKKQDLSNFLFVSNGIPVGKNVKKVENPKNSNPVNDKLAVPVPPTQIKPNQVKRTVALIVDDLGLSFTSMISVRAALKKFVNEQMQDGDLVAIISTGNGAGTTQQFTSDKNQLLKTIDRLKWNAQGRSGITPFAPLGQIDMNQSLSDSTTTTTTDSNGNETTEIDTQAVEQQTYNKNYLEDIFSVGTLGAINYVVKGMRELPGRKSLMLFSDGFPVCTMDSQTGETDLDRCKRMEDAVKLLTDYCNRSSVSIYSFDAKGLANTMLSAADSTNGADLAQSLQDRSQQNTENQEGLRMLADQTGGFAFLNRNDLSNGVNYALEDQNGYYLLGYQPDSDSFDPKTLKFNKIQVKVKRPDLEVRYRNGFYGYTDTNPLEPVTQNPTDKAVAALMSPFTSGEIPLRLNTIFGNNETGSFVNSYVHIDAKNLTFVDQPDGSKKLNFDILASSFGENGATIDQVGRAYRLSVPPETYKQMMEEGFVYSFVFPVKKPGAFQMRVAVRDAVTSKIGSASQFVETPDLKKGRLETSGLILENFTEDPNQEPLQHLTVNDITIGKGDPKVDTSLRKFQQGTFLRYVLEIYNAKLDKNSKTDIKIQTRVFRDGKAVLLTPLKPVEISDQKDLSRLLFGGKLELGNELKPGEYILQVIVKDGLAKEKQNLATQWVSFEIVE